MFARALARSLARLIPDGTPLPVLAGPLKGSWWHAGAAPGPSKGLSIVFNRSEPGQLRAACDLVEPGSICFDIGAHAGMYSLLFARRARMVYAFEPFPPNLARLARTLEANRVENVRVIPFAVAGDSGLTSFGPGVHSSEGRLEAGGSQPVFAVSLAEFCARYGVVPGLIKIDVEGAELDLLRGARDWLRENRPALLLSTHGDDLKRDCLELLRGLGYRRIRPLDAADPGKASEFSILHGA